MIIGLIGYAGSGKDTTADFLVENYNFTKLSFGSILKDVVASLFSWPRELLEGDTNESRIFRETKDEWWSKELNMEITPRKMFQMIGTDIMRNHFHTDIWLLSLKKKLTQYDNVIITDIRFNNEYDFVKKLGGIIIKIVRPNISILNHSSELSIDKFDYDYSIINNDNIESLLFKIIKLIRKLLNKS